MAGERRCPVSPDGAFPGPIANRLPGFPPSGRCHVIKRQRDRSLAAGYRPGCPVGCGSLWIWV